MKDIGSYRLLRRTSQILFLLLFFWLFRLTDYTGTDEISYAVNIFFRWDPLVAISTMLAAKEWIGLLFPSLIVIAVTIVLGRVFCGWLCPLGTLLDGADTLLNTPVKPGSRIRYFKYAILIAVLTASLFGLQLVGFFDPFSILVRGLTFSLDPGMNWAISWIFDTLYAKGPSWLTAVTEPLYSFLRSTLLPYKQAFFSTALLSFLILGTLFALEKLGRRFWCRNLCPLGALLALFSRFSLLRRFPVKSCPGCSQCVEECRMDAFGKTGLLMDEECILCMDCLYDCENAVSAFKFKRPKNNAPLNLNRRVFMASGLAGVTLPVLSKVGIHHQLRDDYLLRPPGVEKEAAFLSKCVRCGECMKVCIQNALQPAFMESGYEGMFSPRLIPRIGYCEFNCNLCAQVCPTGAIPKMDLSDKQKFVIGRAYFDKNRCLPFAENTPCIVCEEHCPTHDKAIKFREETVTGLNGNPRKLKQPYVIKELCIGCGICEKVCPLDGQAAVRVMKEQSDTVSWA